MIRLLELRQERGLTQREVAKSLFVSQGTYNNWENGKTQPSIEQLVALSKFFGESIDFIVENNRDPLGENKEPATAQDPASLIKEIEERLGTLKSILGQ